MKDRLMEITDLNKFAKYIAVHTANEIGIETKKNSLKEYITLKNVKGIVSQYAKIKNGKMCVNNRIMKKIQNELTNWILGVSLAKMAGNDEIDCYWDDTKNCMMFKRGTIDD
jgi:hypothetical protein